MKNSKILVAVMAVMMFSYTKAEEIKVDFDGSIIRDSKVNAGSGRIVFEKWQEFPVGDPKIDEKALAEGKNKANDIIYSAINYAEKNNSAFVVKNLKKLLTCGTLPEKEDFINAGNKNYTFPERIFKLNDDLKTGCTDLIARSRASLVCLEGHYEKNCTDKEVCATEPVCGRVCNLVSEVVCTGASAGAGSAGGPAAGAAAGIGCGVVTNEICDWVCEMKETCQTITNCKDIFVCDEYTTSNPHNGDQIDENGNVVAHR